MTGAAAWATRWTGWTRSSKVLVTIGSSNGSASAPAAFTFPIPKTSPHPGYLIPATNQILQEFAELLHVVANAAADNQITNAEATDIRARWEELKSVTEGFVECCESGNFGPLKPDEAKKIATD